MSPILTNVKPEAHIETIQQGYKQLSSCFAPKGIVKNNSRIIVLLSSRYHSNLLFFLIFVFTLLQQVTYHQIFATMDPPFQDAVSPLSTHIPQRCQQIEPALPTGVLIMRHMAQCPGLPTCGQ